MARPGKPKRKPPQVLLFSTTLGTWEVWSQSRPLAQGSVQALRHHYPDAQGPSAMQEDIEARYLEERA